MNEEIHLVVFTLGEMQFALSLAKVERIARSTEITPLPLAHESVLGIINVQGKIVPVVDLRKRFHLPERKLKLDDLFIIGRTSKRTLAIVVDTVVDISKTVQKNFFKSINFLSDMDNIQGVVKLDNGILLILDIDKMLSLDDESMLDKAIETLDKSEKSVPKRKTVRKSKKNNLIG